MTYLLELGDLDIQASSIRRVLCLRLGKNKTSIGLIKTHTKVIVSAIVCVLSV